MNDAATIATEDILLELARCDKDVRYFIEHYVFIENPTLAEWVPFHLWPAQVEVLGTLQIERQPVILKARQLGLTWLCLAYILHILVFRSSSSALLFSRRDTEATHLLETRLKGMYRRLPDWMKWGVEKDDMHHWSLSNGSSAQAFPAKGGDSYTASVALIDEADLIPKLNDLLGSVKPTVADGGQIILLSRSDKAKPNSPFKRIYRAAKAGENKYYPVFLPWAARPSRDHAWYNDQRQDILSRTGSLDGLHEQYPESEEEALAPATLNKRIPPSWLKKCYIKASPIYAPDAVADIAGLVVYKKPIGRLICGADPAEGNPNSDPSAATWLDGTGEEVASLTGQYEPGPFARLISRISVALGGASVMVERNNHGHAVLLWLRDNTAAGVRVLNGRDKRPGWVSSALGKTMMYDAVADAAKHTEITVHSLETYLQLCSIEASTLRAPEGEHDDRADSVALCTVARNQPKHWLLS